MPVARTRIGTAQVSRNRVLMSFVFSRKTGTSPAEPEFLSPRLLVSGYDCATLWRLWRTVALHKPELVRFTRLRQIAVELIGPSGYAILAARVADCQPTGIVRPEPSASGYLRSMHLSTSLRQSSA